MSDKAQYIGTGWAFPPTFDKASGGTLMTSGEEDIRASLHILLSTALGERIMHPDFGCNLRDYVFESVNFSMDAYIKKLVHDAITYYEPRITLEALTVEFNTSESKMEILIEFVIDANNSRANYVYPFYIKEGTNI